MLYLSSIVTHGFGREYEYDAYLSYRKQRKICSVQSMLLFGQGVVGYLRRCWLFLHSLYRYDLDPVRQMHFYTRGQDKVGCT